VRAALEQGGLPVLARLGAGVRRVRQEPMHQALVAARSAADAFARWGRLERYVHSRHRLVVEQLREDAAGGTATLRHAARTGPPPLAAEDLVVLGVLAALLDEIGLQDVRARVGEVPVLPASDAAALDAAAQAGATDRWTLCWRGAVADRVPAPASPAGLPDAVATALHDDARWPPLACEAARRLAVDLGQTCTLAELAAGLGLSARTLQRHLAAAGLTYSAVLAQPAAGPHRGG
jgi:hypothetical protein